MIRFIISLLMFLLAGCKPASPMDALLSDYMQRISRVTEISITPASEEQTPRLPPLSERAFDIPDIRMKALKALDLLECPRLSKVVAYRNSSLGRQMQPSQRLHYEKELLNELSACIQHLQDAEPESDILPELRSVTLRKRDQLPAIRWNTLFGHVELADQLMVSMQSLPDEHTGQNGTLSTLHYLSHYFADQSLTSPYTRPEMESRLQQLIASHYSGQLIRSAVELTYSLNEVARMLEHRLQQQPLCPNGRLMPAAERLQNVFRRLYANGVQTYLSRIHREGAEWRTAMHELLRQLPVPPSAAMQFYLQQITSIQSPSSIWWQLDQATRHHTIVWQTVLGECGLPPGLQQR